MKHYFKYLTLIISLVVFFGISDAHSAVKNSSDYSIGKVVEILSEKTIVDESFGRKELKFKFTVQFLSGPLQNQTKIIEQSYSEDEPERIFPRKGKQFLFLQEETAQNSQYIIVDVYQLNETLWGVTICLILILIFGRWNALRAISILLLTSTVFIGFRYLNLPILLNIFLVLLIGGCLSILVLSGFNKKWLVNVVSLLVNINIIAAVIWCINQFSPSLTLENPLIATIMLSIVGLLMYITSRISSAIYQTYKEDPTLSQKELYQQGMKIGRESIESILMVVLFIYISHILVNLYNIALNDWLDLTQLNTVMTSLTTLFITMLGLVIALPLTAFLSLKILYRKEI